MNLAPWILTWIIPFLKMLPIFFIKMSPTIKASCYNPSLGLVTKARGMERCGPRVQLESHIHILKSAGECEGMSPHTPKWAPTLGLAFESIKEFWGASLPIFNHGISNFLFSIKIINNKLNVHEALSLWFHLGF